MKKQIQCRFTCNRSKRRSKRKGLRKLSNGERKSLFAQQNYNALIRKIQIEKERGLYLQTMNGKKNKNKVEVES